MNDVAATQARCASDTSTDGRVGWDAALTLGLSSATAAPCWRREHAGPLVVQKALHPEGDGVCQAIVVHPPGGIAGGDRLTLAIDVGARAHAQLTTPGAAKWYRSAGAAARQSVEAACGAGRDPRMAAAGDDRVRRCARRARDDDCARRGRDLHRLGHRVPRAHARRASASQRARSGSRSSFRATEIALVRAHGARRRIACAPIRCDSERRARLRHDDRRLAMSATTFSRRAGSFRATKAKVRSRACRTCWLRATEGVRRPARACILLRCGACCAPRWPDARPCLRGSGAPDASQISAAITDVELTPRERTSC